MDRWRGVLGAVTFYAVLPWGSVGAPQRDVGAAARVRQLLWAVGQSGSPPVPCVTRMVVADDSAFCKCRSSLTGDDRGRTHVHLNASARRCSAQGVKAPAVQSSACAAERLTFSTGGPDD